MSGRSERYAWVQTSATLYVFVPVPEDVPPAPRLALSEYGTAIRLEVGGEAIFDGLLANDVKPGDEVWMIEEAKGGREYVVVELPKERPGREWTSVMKPEVKFVGDYVNMKVRELSASEEEQEATVEATLHMLQRKQGQTFAAGEGHEAAAGDVLLVDLLGYEQEADGSRGALLDMGMAESQEVEIGPQGSGLTRELREGLVGIKKGETRDLQVTLGSRAGGMGGQQIICAVTCQEIYEQRLPDIDDDFAREVKRAEQFAQAGTEEGIPDEEEGLADTFTLEQLRQEIREEVERTASEETFNFVRQQVSAGLLAAVDVKCDDWATFDDSERLDKEIMAAVEEALAEKEDLPMVDQDWLKRRTWHELGKPGADGVAEVGSDPDKEYQVANIKIYREMRHNQVMDWLVDKASIETVDVASE